MRVAEYLGKLIQVLKSSLAPILFLFKVSLREIESPGFTSVLPSSKCLFFVLAFYHYGKKERGIYFFPLTGFLPVDK